MGKTAVFVVSVLQQIEPEEGKVQVLVLCHTRELAYQVPQHHIPFLATAQSSGRRCAAVEAGMTMPGHAGPFLFSIRCVSKATIQLVQICHEFERFSAYMDKVHVGNYFGGFPIKQHKKTLKESPENIIVGTPGRLKQV